MIKMKRRGQAEIMDGLILMLIAAICSTVLLTISSSYGVIPVEVYQETYAQKLAQNTLLSLYHITDQDEQSPYYRKSIMVAVSQDLASGDITLSESDPMVREVLDAYGEQLGWEFMFAVLSGGTRIMDETIISTDPSVDSAEKFDLNVGKPYCASAALTYPQGDCSIAGGGSAGNMCYAIFQICVWQP